MFRPASFLALTLLAASPSLAQQGRTLQRAFNGRSCRVYVPSSYRPNDARPLVVLLHGCTQDPADFARGTAFDALAEREGLLVLYPEQPQSANSNQCWNWFETAHQARGRGEPASIVGCVEGVASEFSVDRERVYVAGISAGGAMSSILGATYPDVFAAIGVHSGLEYAAADGMGSAFSAMFTGGPDPEQAALDALRAMGSNERALPVLVVHGADDYTVRPINAEQTIAQFAQVADLALDGVDNDDVSARPSTSRSGTAPGGRRYAVFDHHAPGGSVLLRYLRVEGMGHAWSGGDASGSYTDPAGPSASEALWAFFSLHRRNAVPAPTTPTPTPMPAPTPMPMPAPAPTPRPAPAPTPRPAPAPTSLPAPTPTQPAPVPCGCAVQVRRLVPVAAGTRARYVAFDRGAAATLKVGDDGRFQRDLFRGFLAFDGGALPAGTTVRGATLRLRRVSATGSLQGLELDLQLGYLGKGPELARDDFDAPASNPTLATTAVPSSDGAWLEVDLPAAALAALSAGGRVELRLRAAGHSPQFQPQNVEFHLAGSDAPELVVRY